MTVELGNKKCRNFNTYNVVLFLKKKKKEKTWRYHCFTPVYQIS